MKKILFALVALFVVVSGLNAQPTYETTSGDEFIFCEKDNSLQKYGYMTFHLRAELSTSRLSYSEYVGKKGKITKTIVKDEKYGISEFTVVVLENNQVVYVDTHNGEVRAKDVIFTKTISLAERLIGKPIWISQAGQGKFGRQLFTEDESVSYPVHNLERVMVVGVFLKKIGHGSGAGEFYLVCEKANKERGLQSFDLDMIVESDPFVDIDDDTRRVIEEEKIKIGMTEEQVLMSWGKPKKINKTVTSASIIKQWIYGNQYLHFHNGILESFTTL